MDHRKEIFIFIGVIVFTAIIFISFLLFYFSSSSQNSLPHASPSGGMIEIPPAGSLSVIPESNVELKPGDPLTFQVTLGQGISADQVLVVLAERNIVQADFVPTPFNTKLEDSGTVIRISAKEDVQAETQYLFKVILKGQEQTLYEEIFTSGQNLAPHQSNNPELKQFLPHETENYILSYAEARDVYIFNFKVDLNSRESFDSQYATAQNEAESFIRSKGISLDSIQIEWRKR